MKEQALWEKYAEGMPRAVFDALIQKNADEQRAAAAALSAEQARLSDRTSLQAHVTTLYEVLGLLPNISAVPVREANRVLRACIRQITYHRAPAVKQPGGNRGGWNSSPIELSIDLAF